MVGDIRDLITNISKTTGDLLIEDADFDACEMIVLPGGLPGTDYLAADERLTTKIKEFAAAGKKVAAICAAPTVLAEAMEWETEKSA